MADELKTKLDAQAGPKVRCPLNSSGGVIRGMLKTPSGVIVPVNKSAKNVEKLKFMVITLEPRVHGVIVPETPETGGG